MIYLFSINNVLGVVEDLFCQIMLRFGRCIIVENTFYITIYKSVYNSVEKIDTAAVHLFGQK